MPKFGSHILFAEEAVRRRSDKFPNLHETAYRFGAVGPDVTLFMLDPASSNPDIRKGINIALQAPEKIQEVKEEAGEGCGSSRATG